MKWFKFYGQDYLSDPKILALSSGERSCWITLLSYGSVNDNGVITFLNEHSLLMQAGIDPTSEEWDKCEGVLNKLEMLGMITNDNGTITLKNWRKRQESNLTSYERVKRHREKKRNDNANDNDRIEKKRIYNISDSSKKNQNKNKMIKAYDENEFSQEKTIDADGNPISRPVKEKKVPPQKRLDAENFLKEYNAKYKKIIGGDVPHYPKGAYLKQVYSVLGKYDLEKLKGMLDDYFDDDFYKESNWAIWTFLSWKVLNRLNK